MDASSNREPNTSPDGAPHRRSPPYAFFVAALAIVAACTVFGLSMWIFAELFNNATTVTTALGSLFTLIGTVVGAYFGIKVSNDTSERSQGAIERERTAMRRRRTEGPSKRTVRHSKPSPSWIPRWLGASCRETRGRRQDDRPQACPGVNFREFHTKRKSGCHAAVP